MDEDKFTSVTIEMTIDKDMSVEELKSWILNVNTDIPILDMSIKTGKYRKDDNGDVNKSIVEKLCWERDRDVNIS